MTYRSPFFDDRPCGHLINQEDGVKTGTKFCLQNAHKTRRSMPRYDRGSQGNQVPPNKAKTCSLLIEGGQGGHSRNGFPATRSWSGTTAPCTAPHRGRITRRCFPFVLLLPRSEHKSFPHLAWFKASNADRNNMAALAGAALQPASR